MFSSFNQNMGDYNHDAFQWVLTMSFKVILPIAFYLALFFFMFEIINVVVPKTQAGESIVLKDFAFAGVRLLVALAFASMGVVLFVFIVGISTGTINLFNSNGGSVTDAVLHSLTPQIEMPNNPLSALGDLLGSIMSGGGFITNAISGLLMFIIALLVQAIVSIVVAVIVYLRFFQLFLLAFLSPIPLVSIASREYDSIAKNYLKLGFAYAFQTVVIVTIMWLFSFFAQPTVDLSGSASSMSGLSAWGNALGSIVKSIAYVIVIWQSLSVSKKLFGVGV